MRLPNSEDSLFQIFAKTTVRIEGSLAGAKMTLWKAMGQVILAQEMTTADLEIGAFPAGLYQVVVQ